MSSVYDGNWGRFLLVCKPEQSGKTFVMIQKIIKGLREPMNGIKSHFWTRTVRVRTHGHVFDGN